MNLGARIAAAIELLDAVLPFERPADQLIADYLRGRRYIGAKDRRVLLDTVYSALRAHARLGWWCQRIGQMPDARRRILSALRLIDGLSVKQLDGLFSGRQYAPDALTRTERRALGKLDGHTLDHPDQTMDVRLELPEWAWGELQQSFGESAVAEAQALLTEAPVDLRVNSLKADRAQAAMALSDRGIETEETPISPLGLRIASRSPIAGTDAFRAGWLEVQDEASQIAALLVDAKPGMRVLDFCAGAGGKSLAMAAAMENRGQVLALDVLKGRLERAGTRLRRAGVHNVERHLISSHRDPWLKRRRGKFDRVLIDAPCSGTGAWRRNPDARWRLAASGLEELIELQREILASAARAVRPGGRLIYATCSLLARENDRQVAAFLDDEPDFAVLPVHRLWPDVIGGNCPAADDFLTLTPQRNATDGFFVAIMERRSGDTE